MPEWQATLAFPTFQTTRSPSCFAFGKPRSMYSLPSYASAYKASSISALIKARDKIYHTNIHSSKQETTYTTHKFLSKVRAVAMCQLNKPPYYTCRNCRRDFQASGELNRSDECHNYNLWKICNTPKPITHEPEHKTCEDCRKKSLWGRLCR